MSDLIKILFLAANPTGMAPLQLDHESRAIDQALRSSNLRDRFVLEDHWAVRVRDLQELLLRHEPHIVHFSGPCVSIMSEYNFGNCPKNYKLVWGPYCRASDHPYIQPGRYRVSLSGTGTVTAGATDYGTFFNLYGFGKHTITLPGSYTFCWPGRASGGYGFETIVQAGGTNDQITNIRIEYLGPC